MRMVDGSAREFFHSVPYAPQDYPGRWGRGGGKARTRRAGHREGGRGGRKRCPQGAVFVSAGLVRALFLRRSVLFSPQTRELSPSGGMRPAPPLPL